MFPAGLRVRATPTLVLVNREGTILHAWEGVGPDRQAADRSRPRSTAALPAKPRLYFQPIGFPAICSSSHALSGAK